MGSEGFCMRALVEKRNVENGRGWESPGEKAAGDILNTSSCSLL